jgi:hypothetical protein
VLLGSSCARSVRSGSMTVLPRLIAGPSRGVSCGATTRRRRYERRGSVSRGWP